MHGKRCINLLCSFSSCTGSGGGGNSNSDPSSSWLSSRPSNDNGLDGLLGVLPAGKRNKMISINQLVSL